MTYALIRVGSLRYDSEIQALEEHCLVCCSSWMATQVTDEITPQRLKQALVVAAELLADETAPTWPFRILEEALRKEQHDDVRLRAARLRAEVST